ncbi:hypothetical protein GCM10023334_098830 [Nonomuraea thailandensis]
MLPEPCGKKGTGPPSGSAGWAPAPSRQATGDRVGRGHRADRDLRVVAVAAGLVDGLITRRAGRQLDRREPAGLMHAS